MRRRDFIAALGGAATSLNLWPLAACAQRAMPVVGFLRSTSLEPFASLGVALRQGLKEAGFVEGRNVAIESRYADNQADRLPLLAAELVRHPVAVLVGNSPSARAAMTVTTTTPIVFTIGGDPVRDGLVSNMNRPGGNVTGVSFLAGVVSTKRFELVRQFVPRATSIAVMINPNTPETDAERTSLLAAAQAIGQQIIVLDVTSDRDIETGFATAIQRGAGAMFIGTGSFMTSKRLMIVSLAARHALPTMYNGRESVEAGGLMSYGTSQTEAYRQAGIYAGRVLKGEKPGDLPVTQSTKFEFAINLKTAKALGLEFHPQLLATADEVIE
jgi:putative tryptophan/tyrosine transport system substrate-binding protein